MRYAIDIKGNNIFLSNNPVVHFLSWTAIERTRNEALQISSFSFRVNITITIFEFAIVESTQVIYKPKKFLNVVAFRKSCFFA